MYDSNFKFVEVIEVFTSYDKFHSSDLKKLNSHKSNLEAMKGEKSINKSLLINEFISVAKIIAPNLENKESVNLLESVINNEIELNSYLPASTEELNIMTIHKSKGLEFDVILHLDLYEWVLPAKKVVNNDFNNPIYSNWNQDLNLHYVGLTRARKGCILLSSTKRLNNKMEIKNAKDSEFVWLNGIEKLRYQAKR